jgi:hypothetical protein
MQLRDVEKLIRNGESETVENSQRAQFPQLAAGFFNPRQDSTWKEEVI